jgi:DNA (cytosine-5)-methyltransferase 1
MTTTQAHIKALDLFAGTGWGVACQRLGIKEAGVEIMPEAVATRTANGMETIYNDVWDGLKLTAEQHREKYGSYGLLIASPPCQTFSMAGQGSGRDALNEVLEAIELHAYKDADALRAFGNKHDPRTALVLTPLAYVWRDRSRLVALEQVPAVLPVWEACAEVMREWGYEVKVEVLNAEQYGVPQTRKRAILVARRGGPVSLPRPTHSRYHSRTPGKVDAGVQKWVSMADALGESGFTAEKVMGRGMVERHGTRPGRSSDQPAFTIRASAGGMEPGGFVLRRGLNNRPVPTITGGGTEAGGAEPIAKFHERYTHLPAWEGPIDRLTPVECATLQSYPTDFGWIGTKTNRFLQVGNAVPPLLAEHILAALIGIKEGR